MMKAAILGFGKSGNCAYKLLKQMGYEDIDIFDDASGKEYPSVETYVDIYDKTVVSPGIDVKKHSNIPAKITSEAELAFEAMNEEAKIIAITGTNGKSTTTHLTAQILNNAGVKTVACGNIGFPFGEAVSDKNIKVFALELSSFQIDLLKRFKAEAACVINVTQDHLDRYGSMEAYYAAKLKLLKFIDEDGLFFAGKDPIIEKAAENYKFISKFIDKNLSVFPKLKGKILDFGSFGVDTFYFNLYGRHNMINLAFALGLASRIVPFEGDVTEYIKGLSGMPHRTETVGIYDGVTYINDSKGTNVDSVITALESAVKPTYLLIGGRDKKSDYTALAPLINKNVSRLIYFGEAAGLIKGQLKGLINAEEESFNSLEEAVKYSAQTAEKGATVLLSPACTSFDEFKSYEDRGEKFALYVKKYAGGEK